MKIIPMWRSLRMAKSTAIQQTMYFHSSPLVTLQQEKLLRSNCLPWKFYSNLPKSRIFLLWIFKPTRKPLKGCTNKKFMCKLKGNTVTADFTADHYTSLFFTLPYDKGWAATINNQPVPIEGLKKDLMAVDVPKRKRTGCSTVHTTWG